MLPGIVCSTKRHRPPVYLSHYKKLVGFYISSIERAYLSNAIRSLSRINSSAIASPICWRLLFSLERNLINAKIK